MSNEIVEVKNEVGLSGPRSKYPLENWTKGRLAIEITDKSLKEISVEVDIPYAIFEKTARRKGWLVTRQKRQAEAAEISLDQTVRDISYQINDLNKHELAELEALQYSYRIQVVVDDDGYFHYRNFEDFPGRPENWNDLDDLTKQSLLSYIHPPRLEAFLKSLNRLKLDRLAKLDFVTKLVKGSLPKIDPNALNISATDADASTGLVTNSSIFVEKKDSKVKKKLEEASKEEVKNDGDV